MADEDKDPGDEISIIPRAVYGLSSTTKNNIIYTSEHHLAHPCSSIIVIDDMVSKKQSFVYLGQTPNTVDRIAVTVERTHLAIAERGERPRIAVYDLKTYKRVKLLGNPYEDMKAKDYIDMSFTSDGEHLIALFGKPDFEMLDYDWVKGKVVNRIKVSEKRSPVVAMEVNPFDPEQLVFVGCGVYNRMNVIDHTWKTVGTMKTRLVPFSSVCWLNEKQVAAGTEDGRILIMEPAEIRAIYRALTLQRVSAAPITVVKKSGTGVVLDSKNIPVEDKLGKHAVLHLTNFTRGIAYSCQAGIIYLFEEIDKHNFVRKNVFNVNRCLSRTAKLEGRCNQIVSMAFSPSGQQFAITTDMFEIYVAPIFQEQNFQEVPFLTMKPFESGYHNGPVSQISLSQWKPFLLSLGETDKSLRLWNYETKKLVTRIDFPKDIYCAAINPTGLLCLLGFTDYLSLNVFVLKNIEEINRIALTCCPFACFSSTGSKFGAYADDRRTIYVYNTLDGKQIHLLKGHVGPLTGLTWSLDDYYMWSRGEEGSIYKWNMQTGKRDAEVFTAGVAHLSLALSPDGNTAYVASNDGLIRVIENGEISREINVKHKILLTVVSSNNGKILLTSGEKSTIIAFEYPLVFPFRFKEYLFHSQPVNMMKLTFHSRVLISVSTDGTICFWEVKGPISTDPPIYLRQMMIPLDELTRRDKSMEDTVNKMATYVAETKLNLQELTSRFNSELDSIVDMKNEKIDDLKKRLSVMEQDCILEMSFMKQSLLEEFQKAEEDRQRMENTMSDSLIKQYKKYQELSQVMEEQTIQFNIAKDNLELITKESIENAEIKVKKYLNACSELVKMLILKKYADNKQDEDIRVAIEEDCDKEISHMRKSLEKLLKEEEAKNHALKCENLQLKEKFKSVSLKIEIMKTNIDQLYKENNNLKKKMSEMQKENDVVSQELEEHLKSEALLENQVKTMIEEKQGCEKDKLVTAHVAEEMRSLLEPQQVTIFNLKEQNNGLTMEIKTLHRREVNFKNEIDKLKLLLKSSSKENRTLKQQYETVSNRLKSLRSDMSMIKSYEAKKLVNAFNLVIKKHISEPEKMGDLDIPKEIEKELKPHEYKILQLIATGPKTKVCPKRKKYPKHKLLKENRFLIEKLEMMNVACGDKTKSPEVPTQSSEIFLGGEEQRISKIHFKSSKSEEEPMETKSHVRSSDEGLVESDTECKSYDTNKVISFSPSSQMKIITYTESKPK